MHLVHPIKYLHSFQQSNAMNSGATYDYIDRMLNSATDVQPPKTSHPMYSALDQKRQLDHSKWYNPWVGEHDAHPGHYEVRQAGEYDGPFNATDFFCPLSIYSLLISTLILLLNLYKMAPIMQLNERDASCPGGVSTPSWTCSIPVANK